MPQVITTCPKCRAQYSWNSDFGGYPDCPRCGYNQMEVGRTKWQECCEAVQRGDIELVKKLLKHPDMRTSIFAGPLTLLHHAAIADHAELVRYLIRQGIPRNTSFPQTDDETPLHAAARHGCLNSAKALVEAGAQVDAKNASGKTPLDLARRTNCKELVAFLEGCAQSDRQAQALQRAAEGGDTARLAALLSRGADVNQRDSRLGRTALHAAAGAGNVAAVTCLLENGADPNVPDHSHWTPLHMAVGSDSRPEIVQALLGRGADVNARDSDRETPLHHAVIWGNEAMIKLLIDAGADVGARNLRGEKPRHKAPRPTARLLRQYGRKWWQLWR
jgi:ankyrin repeat protein